MQRSFRWLGEINRACDLALNLNRNYQDRSLTTIASLIPLEWCDPSPDPPCQVPPRPPQGRSRQDRGAAGHLDSGAINRTTRFIVHPIISGMKYCVNTESLDFSLTIKEIVSDYKLVSHL